MSLLLTFGGDEVRVEPGETLTFGRSGELVIDATNRHLHRVLGCFASAGESWFLQNMGRFTTLVVSERTGPEQTASAGWEVAPGAQAPLPEEGFTVVFTAGPRTYRLDGSYSARPCTS